MTNSAQGALYLLEKSYAHEAVAAPATDAHRMLWVGTSVGVAGVPLLIGAGELDEIIETPAVAAIPGTKPWVMGIAAYEGGLLPIVSGDVFFRRVPYLGRLREYCMVVRRPGFNFGITLSHVEGDLKFPIEDRDMNRPVDADVAPYCLGGFRRQEQFLAVLDIDKLVADSELSNASVTAGDLTEDDNR